MHSKKSKQFNKLYTALPTKARNLAEKSYKQWKQNHNHPGLNFKIIDENTNLYSVRIGDHHRAMGFYNSKIGCITWVWIGTHEEYNKLI